MQGFPVYSLIFLDEKSSSVRGGTLFATIYVGLVVRFASPHLGWFDRLLAYVPGFRRYLFGLARWLYRRGSGSEK